MSFFSIFPLLAGTLMIIYAVEEEEEAVVEENIEDAMKKKTPTRCILLLNGLKRGVMSIFLTLLL
jgi:hypothetical protein